MIKRIYLSLLLFFSFSYHAISNAQEKTYFGDHERGWHWYESHQEADDENENAEEDDAISQMNVVQMAVKRALDQAILYPSKENVKHYIALQNAVAERSALFAKLWQEALLAEPALDFSLRHPTNNLARQIEVDQENAEQEQAIKLLAKESGLFFFYRSTCPYCRAFAPILKRFTDYYKIPVIAITTDGMSLPPFPDSLNDQGQSAIFQVKVEPSLFVVNPYTKKVIPVGYGLMSETDLKKRMLEIARMMSARV